MDTKAMIVVAWWAQRFQHANKREFALALRKQLDENAPRILDVDYDPKKELLTAVRESGIECAGTMFSADGILPQKTTMWIDATKIEVREGRGAPIETIWDASWFEESNNAQNGL